MKVVLLTGAMRGAERAEALAALAAGEADIAIGTHALIQEGVAFRELAVAVVDEQHRFGVEQRAALRQKGVQPHMLVMSATPIPRSLALTVYGDLDISVIDEMPAGRTPIKTKWLTSSQRERAYDFIRRQAASGRQAFIIYPLVEESENSEATAAVEEHARLKQTIFPDLRVGLLHGRMRGEEKDRVMRAFSAGESDVLVATSVVEVGIDVPNATVIMIEGAERFGLAQLHQFRGRVGRGEYPSYCILISDATEGESVNASRRWRTAPMALPWRKSTWSCAVPVTSSARARAACRRSRRRNSATCARWKTPAPRHNACLRPIPSCSARNTARWPPRSPRSGKALGM